MKKIILALFLFIQVFAFSQSTGSYWKVDNLTTPLGRAFPDASKLPEVYVKSNHSRYQLTATALSTATMATIIAAGNCYGLTPWQVINGVITPTDVTNRVIHNNGTFIYPGDGDVNGSGTITSMDALMINLYLMGQPSYFTDLQKSRADVNGDGKITKGDAYLDVLRAGNSPTGPWTGQIYGIDSTRYFLANTLYQPSPGKVKLAGTWDMPYGTPTAYDVETGGNVRIPTNYPLYFGASSYTTAIDSVIKIFKASNRNLGIVGQLNMINGTLAKNASVTLTAAEMLSGVIYTTSSTGWTFTMPTATAIMALIPGGGQGTTFDLFIDNSAGAQTVTMAVGSGITVQGTPAITGGNSLLVTTANKVGQFRFYFTSTTTAMVFRVF